MVIRYIKPETEIIEIELQQVIAQSLPTTSGEATEWGARGTSTNFDFFAAPEVEEETQNTQKNQEEDWDDFEEEEI